MVWSYALAFLAIIAAFILTARVQRRQRGTRAGANRIRLTPNTVRALYALGNQVCVFERLDSRLNWDATIIATKGDMVTVRDIQYPFGIADVNRADIFPIGTDFYGAGYTPTQRDGNQ